MNWIRAENGEHYRRWVNIIPAILWPGAAQWMAGRRIVGLAWFLASLSAQLALVGFVILPDTGFSAAALHSLQWAHRLLLAAAVVDGLRRPIKRLHVKGWLSFACLWLCMLLGPFLVVRTFFVQPFKVPTGGMHPTLAGIRKEESGSQISGDHILVNKLIYRLSSPRRGDVVVFRTKGITALKQDTCFVQRVVGLAGETVCIDPPYVVVDGHRVAEPPIFQKIAGRQDGFEGYYLAGSNVFHMAFLKRLKPAGSGIRMGE